MRQNPLETTSNLQHRPATGTAQQKPKTNPGHAATRRSLLLTALCLSTTLMLPPLLGACGKKNPLLQAVPAGATVLAFGDSVTYGTGAQAGQDWPSLLAGMSGWNVVNAGIAGDTAAQGKNRLPELLATHSPKLLIIEIGGNDFLRRTPPSTVKADVRHMIEQAQAAKVQVVLVAVPAPSLLGIVAKNLSDAPLYAELGDEKNIPVIANVFADVLATEALRADPIHPNAAGYRRMAEGIYAALRGFGA